MIWAEASTVAICLHLLRARHQFLAAFVGLGLGLIALGGLLPGFDLLLHRLGRPLPELRFDLLGGGAHGSLADGLRLEEGPQVRGLDVIGERARLRALAERLRKRKHEREDGDEQCDFLVGGIDVSVGFGHASFSVGRSSVNSSALRLRHARRRSEVGTERTATALRTERTELTESRATYHCPTMTWISALRRRHEILTSSHGRVGIDSAAGLRRCLRYCGDYARHAA